jgi:GT2 family glycosyltransferase
VTLERPLFSVVIPTFNRNDALALCLAELAPGRQSRMRLVDARKADTKAMDAGEIGTYEVIVTDAGQTGMAAELIQASYPWARWVGSPGKGPGPNRNNGAKAARGDWLLFIDDDCVPESRLLSIYAEVQQRQRLDVMEGCIDIRGHADSPFRQQPVNVVGGLYWTGNLAIRRDVFEGLKGFDEDYVWALEDMDLAFRIRANGLRTIFCRDAVVWHPSQRVTLKHLFRKRERGRWHVLYRIKTGGSPPLDAPVAIVLATLTSTLVLNELRTTWHLFSRHDPRWWRTRLFFQAFSWVTLPVMLPYFALWELRFRRMLRARAGSHTSGLPAAPDVTPR